MSPIRLKIHRPHGKDVCVACITMGDLSDPASACSLESGPDEETAVRAALRDWRRARKAWRKFNSTGGTNEDRTYNRP